MGGPLVLACAVYAVLCIQRGYAQENCYVAAPNVLRLGTKETMAVMVEGYPKIVDVTLDTYPSKRGPFFTWSKAVTSGAPEIADIIVTEANLPDLDFERGQMHVTLTVNCFGLWKREIPILVSPASGEHFFLQTDKPIYHPGARVNVRFLAVDGELKPSQKSFKLEIRNPQNVIVERKEFRPNEDLLLTHTYDLPPRTLLGEWTLVMKYGYNFLQNTSVTFLVDKYVLPRFKVELSVPEYILSDFSQIPCRMRARFINGQLVHGVVTFQFGVKHEIGDIEWLSSGTTPKLVEGGEAEFVLQRSSLERRLNYTLEKLFNIKGRLVVKATVTEEATAAKESAQTEKTVFSRTPFVISLRKNPLSYIPSIQCYVIAEVSYVNGNPARNVLTKFSLLGTNKKNQDITNTDGVATFAVTIPINQGDVTIQVETIDPAYRQDQQAKGTISLAPYSNAEKGFIGIQRSDPKNLAQAGHNYKATLFAHRFDKISSVFCVVLSKGRVQMARKMADEKVIERSIEFKVTPEMTPTFRLVVFAKLDGSLVADSVYVNAEPACTTTSDFVLERTSQGDSEPLAEETLVATGTPGTMVGLLGVDQAVYQLRKKDLLTREKLFQSLDAKDLGCGAGGGVNAAEALQRSGLVLVTDATMHGHRMNDLGCHGHRRRKRHAELDMLDEYEDKTLRKCCSRGQRQDPFLRSCDDRVRILREYVEGGSKHLSQDCVDAFERCCYAAEDSVAVRSGIGGLDEITDDISDVPVLFRSDFYDTWLFASKIGENGMAQWKFSMPHSITTWAVSAVSVSPRGGVCVIRPMEIVSFKKFFIEVNVPYSVIKKEQVEIPVTVYNYDRESVKAKVVLIGTANICSGARLGQHSEVRTLDIPAGRGRTATFPVVPLASGQQEIHVKAVSRLGSDGVKVKLNVEPPGVEQQRHFTVPLDPTSTRGQRKRDIHNTYTEIFSDNGTQVLQIRRPHPDFLVEHSQHCEIDIVGDAVGAALETAVKDPGRAIIKPSDCGEQTMAKWAPALYAYDYLKATKRIKADDEDSVLDYIRKGYGKMLTFRQTDGSFSIFPHIQPSLWLTAFVLRNLCEARRSVMIDESVITSGLSYMLTQQSQDGQFQDKHRLYDKKLLGGLTGPVALTAYALLTLEECAEDDISPYGGRTSRGRAAEYITRHLSSTDPPGVLAVAAYALSLIGHREKQSAVHWLEQKVHHNPGEKERHVQADSLPLTTYATSFALMTFIKEGKDIDYITSFVRWLNQRMSPRGFQQSTKDTVVAFQALTKYAAYAKENNLDLACEVTVSNNKHFNRRLRIKRDSASVLNKIEIPDPGEQIFVKVNGSGTGVLYFTYTYKAKVAPDDLCKFHITVNFTEELPNIDQILTRVSRSTQGTFSKPSKSPHKHNYRIEACVRPLEDPPDGMVLLDVGLLTGFKANVADLEQLVRDKKADSYDHSSRNVIFYLPMIPRNTTSCVQFSLEQEFTAGKLQSSYVKAYSYYTPEFSCTHLYTPDKTSPLLKFNCEGTDVCTCAEGGCPPENALNRFVKNKKNESYSEDMQRDLLREFACDEADYVWRGTMKPRGSIDGFHELHFHITKVLKPGQESEHKLEHSKRRIRLRDNCASFNISHTEQYIIMGKDSTLTEDDGFGTPEIVYLVDSSTLVFPSNLKNPKKKRLVGWFLKEFSNETTRCYG